jgi:LytS/YehU family sensor histidine kinase
MMAPGVRTNLILIVLMTVVGLLLFATATLDDLARMHHGSELRHFIEAMTGALTVLLLIPGVRWVVRRDPISRATWRSAVPIALLAMAVYTAAHTTLILLTRTVIFPLAGLGPYDYGIMLYRYPMEAANDVLGFSIMYGAIYVIRRLERGRAAELAAAELRTKLAQAQLENLRLQLHPHFLFNTLNAISAVMYEDVRKADDMLAKLSDFLRIVLESGGVEQVTLEEEMRVEHMYVDIMRTRLERPLRLDVRIAPGARGARIPFMLLQPLIENSIQHGLPTGRGDLDIAIGAEFELGQLVIEIVDNGAGYAADGLHGHGLRNVESRMRQTFGPESSFAIAADPDGGTRVRLSYPCAAGAPA